MENAVITEVVVLLDFWSDLTGVFVRKILLWSVRQRPVYILMQRIWVYASFTLWWQFKVSLDKSSKLLCK